MLVYVDSSVALAHLYDEARCPPQAFWSERLFASQLLAYEIWNRVHSYGGQHAEVVGALLARIIMLPLDADVLTRALQPFPTSVRTLDGLHLATAIYLSSRGSEVRLATYDRRMAQAGISLGLSCHASVCPA